MVKDLPALVAVEQDGVIVWMTCPVCGATLRWPLDAPGTVRSSADSAVRTLRRLLADHLHADGCRSKRQPERGPYACFTRRRKTAGSKEPLPGSDLGAVGSDELARTPARP